MKRARAFLRGAMLAGIALAATALHAHDSWIARDGAAFRFATGTRYPRAEFTPPPDSVAQAACRDDRAATLPFTMAASTQQGLQMEAPPRPALGCWIELHEFDIVLEPPVVDIYLRELHPTDEVRTRWNALHAGGFAWHERYRKFARIEVSTPTTSAQELQAIRQPANLDLEIVPAGNSALRAGAPARFVVLSRGEPVGDLAVELVSERNPLGLWSRTDQKGQVSWPLPFSGGWLVRTIKIEPDGAERWKSRFATLSFDAR